MHEMSTSERGLSETLSLVFMAILVAVAALLLVASLTGVISNLLLKPALFSVQVIQFNTSPGGAHIIGVFHQQGDSVDLNGTSQKGGTAIVSLSLIDTTGLSFTVSPDTTVPIQKDFWGPGDLLYIYSSDGGSSYVFSDEVPGSGVPSLPTGTYTVKIIDTKVHVLLNTLPVTIQP
jgi:hypothetical protein